VNVHHKADHHASYFRTGLYPIQSYPYILGQESSGTVAAISGSNPLNLKVGDHVASMAGAAYAAYTAVPHEKILRVPAGISLEDAAAAPLQGLTAWTMLHESYEVKKGDIILITAAAGGVGLWLVQLAKAKGAIVIATSSAHKVQAVRDVGADHVLDYSTDENFVPAVREITKGLGVHAVFDGVGKSTFDNSLASLRAKGTLVSYGNASGAVPPFNIL
jgi:NADPH2:quinone reductase